MSSSLADALVVVAEAFLAGKVAGADDAEVYQVVVHVGTGAISPQSPVPQAADVPATSPAAPADPADPAARLPPPGRIRRIRRAVMSRTARRSA